VPRRHETRPVRLERAQTRDAGVLAIMQGRAFFDELQYAPPETVERLKRLEHPPLGPPGVMDVEWTRGVISSPESVYYKIRLGEGTVGRVIVAANPEKHPEENFWRIFIEPMYQDLGIGQEAFRQIYRLHPDVVR